MPLFPRLRRPITALAITLLATAGCTTGEDADDSGPSIRASPGGTASGVGQDGTTGLAGGEPAPSPPPAP